MGAKFAHGLFHKPEYEDPIHTGDWHDVGDPGEWEQFLSGRNADPTALIPNPMPLRVRIAVGRPNILDQTGAILYYCDKQLEFQGDVADLDIGDTLFNLRPAFRLDHDTPVPGHDDAGTYVPSRLYLNGDFVYGVP